MTIFDKRTDRATLEEMSKLLSQEEVRSPDTAVIIEVVEPPKPEPVVDVDVSEDPDYEPVY